jgi:hypothetical protein
MAAVDVRVTAEVTSRGLAGLRAYASPAALARDVLHLAPGEAKARVDAAAVLGARQWPDSRRLGVVDPTPLDRRCPNADPQRDARSLQPVSGRCATRRRRVESRRASETLTQSRRSDAEGAFSAGAAR